MASCWAGEPGGLRPAAVRASAGGLATLFLALLCAGSLRAQQGSPAGPVPPERLAARRAALLAKLGRGLVLVRSAEERPDEAHAQDNGFRQDDDFFYLTGTEETGALLVGRADGAAGGSWVLYLPDRVPLREQWLGARLGPGAEARALTGIADVRSVRVASAQITAYLDSAGADSRLWVGGAVTRACTTRGGACDDPLVAPVLAAAHGVVAQLAPAIAALRVIKDADEVRRLREAGTITGGALSEAMAACRPGMKEYELETIIEAGFHRRGAERLGFPTIVGSGPNSTVLHYDLNRRAMQAGDLVVLDVGAEYGYYTADVTRTLPVSGSFTPRQRALYELVLGAQLAAIDSIRPGAPFAALERVSRAYMRAHSGTLCGAQPCDRFFVHGISHWLGMDVHDVGSYATTLQPGMVLTVEPGIYIPGESLGVRIEDDVLVTPDGHVVLTRDAPKDPADIERLMQSARSRRADMP